MHMTLSTNVRFSHRLEYLTNFVADGKGFSQLEYEDSSYDSGLDELQETATSQLVEDAAANLNSGDANEVPSNQNQGQQSLSVEDSASQVLAVDSHIAVGPPSSGGEQQITNELATMRKTTQGDLDSLSDEENPVNGDATSVADSLTIPPMHAPEGIEQLQEDLYRDGEAIEDYEDYAHNGQEEDGNNNEDSSAGSSTIQGDSVTEHEDVGSLKAKAAFDGGPTSAEQHIAQVPEQEADDEDVITYETDEEDGNGNFDDSSLQNTEDIGLADAEVAAPKFVAPPDAEGTASHGLMWTSETGADVLHDQDTEAHTTDRDEPEIHSVDGVGAEDEERLEMITEEGTSKSAIPSYHTQVGISTASGPLYAHQEPDQGRILLDPSGLDHTHFQTTKSGVPAPEDEDEITFDDEIEVEAEKEGLAVASTDVASEQTTVSSPGALKRPRATDDDIVLPNTDTKRVRSA